MEACDVLSTSGPPAFRREVRALADRLIDTHHLSEADYEALLDARDDALADHLAAHAVQMRKAHYGTDVYIRGLIEVSSYCRNDCYYCGIRRSNREAARYRLSDEEILACCKMGHALGFRTFVLQGGEDPYFTDDVLVPLIRRIKGSYPDCAVTLSLGERTRESYQALYDAGADRYLLRHETADTEHYAMLHPPELTLENRMRCLRDLKEIGFQAGCGFMVGSPGQTNAHLAKDLAFVEAFHPAMCGIGPFVPHHDTPFAANPAGTVAMTCYLLSILRIMHPDMLLPATTALGTIDPEGREKGICAGANVVMPNLSPADARDKYLLYDGKAHTGVESAEGRAMLEERMARIGYRVVTARGDHAPSAGTNKDQ